MHAQPALCLLGVKHCGKSTLAKYLAIHEGFRIFDTDSMLLQLYQAGNHEQNAPTIPQLYRDVGKDTFTDLEYQSIKILHTEHQNTTESIVISTGGGICDNQRAVELLRRFATLIYIDTPFSLIWERIAPLPLPAFLDGTKNPKVSFHSIYQRRSRIYTEIADIVIDGCLENQAKAKTLLNMLHSR